MNEKARAPVKDKEQLKSVESNKVILDMSVIA